jgi:hypothetical protein
MKLTARIRVTKATRLVLTFCKPNGQVVQTDESVIRVFCDHCRAKIGEPCRGKAGPHAGTHYVRRDKWQRMKRWAMRKRHV